MTWDWQILKGRVERNKKLHDQPLAGYSLFLIQHVLDDLHHLIESFNELGCLPEDIHIVGIPYSSRQSSADLIDCRRIDLPSVFPFDGCVCEALLDAVQRCKRKDNRLIILEDGAYATRVVSQLASLGRVADLDLIVGAVEQAIRGDHIDRQLARRGLLQFPVVSISRCAFKEEWEPPYLAQAVHQNIATLLSHIDSSGEERIGVVGILGYGAVGKAVARRFGKQPVGEGKAEVYISDNNTSRNRLSKIACHRVLTLDIMNHCDLILSADGTTSIDAHVLSHMKDEAVLVSSSSQRVGINLDWLYAKVFDDAGTITPSNIASECVMKLPSVQTFTFDSGNRGISEQKAHVLYDGYPCNFWSQSLPDYAADGVMSLLLEGVVALTTRGYTSPEVMNGHAVLGQADEDILDTFEGFQSKRVVEDGIKRIPLPSDVSADAKIPSDVSVRAKINRFPAQKH